MCMCVCYFIITIIFYIILYHTLMHVLELVPRPELHQDIFVVFSGFRLRRIGLVRGAASTYMAGVRWSVWKRKHENMRKPHVIQDGTSTFWGLSHLQSIAINFNGNMQHPKKGRRWDNPTSVQRGLQLTALISANTAQHYVGPCDCQNSIKKRKNN